MDRCSDLLSDCEPDEALPAALDSDDFRSFIVLSSAGMNGSQHGEGSQDVPVKRSYDKDFSRLLAFPHLPC